MNGIARMPRRHRVPPNWVKPRRHRVPPNWVKSKEEAISYPKSA